MKCSAMIRYNAEIISPKRLNSKDELALLFSIERISLTKIVLFKLG